MRICKTIELKEILHKSLHPLYNGWIGMEDCYLRKGDIVADEKGVRYLVLETKTISVETNERTIPKGCAIYLPPLTVIKERALIKLNKPLENGETLQHKHNTHFK